LSPMEQKIRDDLLMRLFLYQYFAHCWIKWVLKWVLELIQEL
jgi:hypothetical protein